MNKNVLKKLSKIESKVELAEVKVDLALMDDIKAAIGKYKGLDDSTKTAMNKAKTMLIAYSDSVRGAYQNAKSAVDLITELDTKSKELGLADSGMGGYKKEMQGKVTEYNALFKKLDTLINSL